MRITLSDRIVTAVAVAVIAAGVQALLPLTGPGASPAVTASPARPSDAVIAQNAPGAAAQAAAVRYWTPARMSATLQAAWRANQTKQQPGQAGQSAMAKSRRVSRGRPLVKKSSLVAARHPWLTGETAGAGLRWTHGGTVAGAVGKIFFTLGSADYVCSGALVGGGHPDAALTAAHCVGGGPGHGGARQWATNWVFVPGYRNGTMPYGEYTARRFLAAPDWAGPQGGTEQYDVAFVQLTAAALDGGSRPAAGPAGLPLEFASSQDAALPGRGYVFGYPAESPYSGLYPNYCAGPVSPAAGSAATGCAMTAGDSGGPWLAGFSPRTGNGRVFAVSTYKLSTSGRVLYGAVLGPQARALYTRAVSPAR
jgi:V8-like Glu-specific endopeptidase